MNPDDPQLLASLDADSAILPHVPYLLQDLWELGCSPAQMESFIRAEGLHLQPQMRAVDLGCGKGAALIHLAASCGIPGRGIDIMPEFIAEAIRKAREYGVSDRVFFRVGDIRAAIHEERDVPLVIYGIDSDLFGDMAGIVGALRPMMIPGGHLLLDGCFRLEESPAQPGDDAFPTRVEILAGFASAGGRLKREWRMPRAEMQAMNERNNEHIRRRAAELGARFPEQAGLFADYVRRQEEECDILENRVQCAQWLVQVE